MDLVEEYRLKRKYAIEQLVLSSDFDKLKKYVMINGGFDDDVTPIIRIIENKQKIMCCIDMMNELIELQKRKIKSIHGSIDLHMEVQDIISRGLQSFEDVGRK